MSPSENKVYLFILTLPTAYVALFKFCVVYMYATYVPFNNKINGFGRVQLDL